MARANPYGGAFSGGSTSGGVPATSADFFGEGLEGPGITGEAAPMSQEQIDARAKLLAQNAATTTANINAASDRTKGTGAVEGAGGGATGAYDAGSDASRDNYDYMHDLGDNDFFSTPREAMNSLGERVGVSHAGDASGLGDMLSIQNPLDYNPISNAIDPNTGLGTNVGNNGKPATSIAPEAAAVAGQPVSSIAGDALDQALAGLGGSDIPVDASGADRGGMARDYGGDVARVQGKADASRALGQDVLSGNVAGPNAADATRQGDALDQVMGFAGGPKAANDVMGKVNAFGAQPEGPSKAQLLLDDASQRAMSDVLSASRSGRARDAGSMARASNVAQAEIAGMGVDNARNAGLLRADEADKARSQQLSALGLQGNLAQGLDQNTLQALGMGSDIASQMRGAGIQERGQGLSFMQGLEGIGAGMETDALKTIPQFEQIRHEDQFDLTPQQKLVQAKLAGGPEKTTADYVTALLGDVLGVL